MNFCTLSDKNYIPQGKGLLKSLKKVCSGTFVLYYLCLDSETYEEFAGVEGVIPIPLDKVENSRPKILEYKRTSKYNEYCWSLASTFCRFLLEEENLDNILYIDSDIYFYQDPNIIYDEQGTKSIGIIRHRHNTRKSPDGEYNVGIIYFKNDEPGLGCLRWWNDAILDNKFAELATCGDQKYLEQFEVLYPNDVRILDSTFAHGAPWNFRLYVYDDFLEDGTVIWGDKKQPLVFNHFSRMRLDKNQINPTSGNYADHTLNFQVFNIPVVRDFYIKYAQELGWRIF